MLFKLGIYKYYNLFHGKLLSFKYSFDEIKILRSNGTLWDIIVFFFFFILYKIYHRKIMKEETVI